MFSQLYHIACEGSKIKFYGKQKNCVKINIFQKAN